MDTKRTYARPAHLPVSAFGRVAEVTRLGRTILITLAALAVLPGCDATKKVGKGAASAQAPSPANAGEFGAVAAAEALAGGDAKGTGVDSPSLHVSGEIARQCNLPHVQMAPSFEFDSVNIGEQDKNLLSAVARCLGEGPLKGRAVALVGRADPRGEDEYNMVLGNSRSDSVRRFLTSLGVDAARIAATSRGELDATGNDEEGWARDRRVDIELTGAQTSPVGTGDRGGVGER